LGTNTTICPITLAEQLQNETAHPDNDGLAIADVDAFDGMMVENGEVTSIQTDAAIDKSKWGTVEEWKSFSGQHYSAIAVPIAAKRHGLYLSTLHKIERAMSSDDQSKDVDVGSLSLRAVELSRLMHCDSEVVPDYVRNLAKESYEDFIEDTRGFVKRGYFRQATVNLISVQDDIEYLGLEADLSTLLTEMDQLVGRSELYPSKKQAKKQWAELTQELRI